VALRALERHTLDERLAAKADSHWNRMRDWQWRGFNAPAP